MNFTLLRWNIFRSEDKVVNRRRAGVRVSGGVGGAAGAGAVTAGGGGGGGAAATAAAAW